MQRRTFRDLSQTEEKIIFNNIQKSGGPLFSFKKISKDFILIKIYDTIFIINKNNDWGEYLCQYLMKKAM
jgi:hypothetical protein